MSFFRASKLSNKLLAGTYSQKDKFIHYTIWWTLILFLTILKQPNYSHLNTIIEIFTIFLIVLGINFLYKTNVNGDNENFIERMVLLSLPTTLQQFAIGLIILILFMIVNKDFSMEFLHRNNILFSAIDLALVFFYFFRMNKYING